VLLLNVELWVSAFMASHGLITSITAFLNSLRIFYRYESVGPPADRRPSESR
jgi:hypothetical protein